MLIGRNAARDLFDVNNMIYFGTFDESEQSLLKKCILFYYTVGGSKEPQIEFDLSLIDKLTWKLIQESLLPMLRRVERFDLEVAKKRVKDYLTDLMRLDHQEKEFLLNFKGKEYKPELLFDDMAIIERIKNHPMALWKMRDKE